ncbi:nuclear factor 7, ovary-like [Hyperolius riggenbachi]|uniref:nuclear factor 7, ovary-like n=1 Tax=Hyperolius riggenbachi TaxID=752182 RepID=UPI0035A38306
MASRPGNTPQKQGGGEVEPATKKAKIEVTDPQTSKQVGSGDVSEDLICLLCKEIFKDPIIIMCGHNFCRGCMDKAWKGDTFTCPDCKQVINNKMYITNQALANLVKKTAGAAPALPVKKAPVPTHCLDHDEVLKLFCKEDGALMCMICRDSPKHAIHSFLPITDAVEMYKIRLSTIVAPLEEAMKATEQLVDQQNEKIEQNDTNLEECEQHIVGEFEKVRDFLQEKQEALLVKLQDLRAEMQSAINTRKKSKVDLRRAIALAKEKMKETEALSFLTNIKSFMDQCEKQKKEALSFKDAQVVKELDLSAFKQPIQLSLLNEMKFLFAPDVQNHQKPPKKNPDTSVQLIQPKQEEMAMEEDYTQDFEPLEVAPPVKSASTNKAVSKPAPTSAPPQGGKQIWIFGQDLVTQAREQAKVASYGHDLGFGSEGFTVHWMGFEGMRWQELLPGLKKKVSTMGTPNVLVIHLGGNDLGVINRLTLIEIMKKDLATLLSLYPDTAVVWSCVVPRAYWYRVPLERCRKNLNRNICRFGTKMGFGTIYHFQLEMMFKQVRTTVKRKQDPGPSTEQLDIFNLNVQKAITQALSGATAPPEAFEDSS